MRAYRYLHLHVFADTAFFVNQSAVFPGATGLDPELKQRLALAMAQSTYRSGDLPPCEQISHKVSNPATSLIPCCTDCACISAEVSLKKRQSTPATKVQER